MKEPKTEEFEDRCISYNVVLTIFLLLLLQLQIVMAIKSKTSTHAYSIVAECTGMYGLFCRDREQ